MPGTAVASVVAATSPQTAVASAAAPRKQAETASVVAATSPQTAVAARAAP